MANRNAEKLSVVGLACAAVLVLGVAAGIAAAAVAAPVQPAQPPGDQGDKAFADALDGAIAGKIAPETILIFANDRAQKIEMTIYGRGFAFTGGKQYPLDKDQVTAILMRLQKVEFASQPRMVGAPPPGGAVPAPGRIHSNLRMISSDVSVTIDGKEKRVGTAGGNQSPMLADLIKGLQSDAQASKDKAIDLAGLSLQDAFKKVAKGEVAPEALSVIVNTFPRDGTKPFNFQMIRGYVTLNGQSFDKIQQDRKAVEKTAHDLADIFAQADAAKFPPKLFAEGKTLVISVTVEQTGKRLSVNASDAQDGQDAKTAHPDEQKTFDKMNQDLQKFCENLQSTTQEKAPADPKDK
jgi:hypothetical protein